ncbi:hypothetical protein GTQ48_07955 [Alteromonas genovensis]|uniref:DUF3944 domain-containing protein n=1 Tax=Alteromonas genovensis TaxID=471225 RepID=A0A6N9TE71_9ALTE|nr:hypothetical protein [Alteromonas genovensis]NDW15451.1 hypothetical protein [Alteromonas genovensis]
MKKHKYISNIELINLLNKATGSELKSLTNIIKGEGAPNMSPEDICRELFEKGGYLRAVNQVKEKLKVSYALTGKRTIEEIDAFEKLTLEEHEAASIGRRYIKECEEKVIVKLLELTYKNMSDEDRALFDKSVQKVASQYGKSSKGLIGTAGLMAVANMGGFATYTLMSSVLSALSFGTLGFGAYTTASSLLSTVIGPVGWVGLGAYALYKLGQPNYKKLIPAVATIGSIRQRVIFESQNDNGSLDKEEKKHTLPFIIIGLVILVFVVMASF